jgi:hypothetical protein
MNTNKTIIEFKAYVDGIEVAQTGPYDFNKVLNQILDEDPFIIGRDLMERVKDYYSEEAESMSQEDYQRVGH